MAPEEKKGATGDSGGKPRYEAPVLMPLGATAKGEAATCSAGGSPTGQGLGFCTEGRGARGQCSAGTGR